MLIFEIENSMKKTFLLFVLLFLSLAEMRAQFLWAEIGVDGLTCSACSRSVEMSVRKLDFVDSVVMNLEHTDGKVYFKKSAKVEPDKIAQAVVNAGFSVRFLKANFNFSTTPVKEGQFTFDNTIYHFVKTPAGELKGEHVVTFIGKDFLSKKEFSHWKNELKPISSDKKTKVYYIVL